MKRFVLLAVVLAVSGVWAIDGVIWATRQNNVGDMWTGILSKRPPVIQQTSRIVRGEPVNFDVFFSNAELDSSGKCKVSGLLRMVDPAGKEVFCGNLKLQQFKIDEKGRHMVYMFPDRLTLIGESSDPLGKYGVYVTLKDEISGKSVELKPREVELADKNTDKIAENPIKELTGYYRNTQEQNIIPGFRQWLSQLPQIQKKQGRNFNPTSMMALFYWLLQENPQLYGEFALETGKISDRNYRRLAVIICHELGDKVFNALKESDRALWDSKFSGIFVLPEEVKNPVQLDILWSYFFATGKSAPVLKIAGVCSRMKEGISPQDFKKIAAPTPDDRQKLLNYIMGYAAIWSLRSNAKQHMLVAQYLEAALVRGKLSDKFAQTAVKSILKELNKSSKDKKDR